MKRFLVFLIASIPVLALSQENGDSLGKKDSTVIIKKAPLLIVEKSYAKWFFQPNASVVHPFNQYEPCASCKEYLSTYLDKTSDRFSYGFGSSVLYMLNKKIALGLNIQGVIVNENYKSSFGDVKNRYFFLQTLARLGYWINREGDHFSFMPFVAAGADILCQAKGTTLKKEGSIYMDGQLSKNAFQTVNGIGEIGIIGFYAFSKYRVFFQPSFQVPFNDFTQDGQPYKMLRFTMLNSIGILLKL